MRYRDVRRALIDHGCTSRPGKGDHEVWYCPCGGHMAVVTTAGAVSPGVVGDMIKKLTCLPTGWLK
jgi:hypothetical protein